MSSKRSLSSSPTRSPEERFKRPKVGSTDIDDEFNGNISGSGAAISNDVALAYLAPTPHACARTGIQRSIAVVLKHDGFVSSNPDAMESFTSLVETYLESFIEEIQRLAYSSRRSHPSPIDFEVVLRRFNLPIASLRPHLKNPVTADILQPKYKNICFADQDAYTSLPLLGPELSGQADKDTKKYIPASFPDFPSRHTYQFTPQEDTDARDSMKMREEAARTAQQGEDALRRLVRASKMRKQKEAKTLVERNDEGKERFRHWESTMRRFMQADNLGEHAEQVEIADYSMIVNGDAMFARKEVSRLGKRPALMTSSAS